MLISLATVAASMQQTSGRGDYSSQSGQKNAAYNQSLDQQLHQQAALQPATVTRVIRMPANCQVVRVVPQSQYRTRLAIAVTIIVVKLFIIVPAVIIILAMN